MSFPEENLFVVRRRIRCWRCRKLFTFPSSSSEPLNQISTKLGTKHPWVMGIQDCSTEVPHPFPRGDNNEMVKIHRRNLKIFFSITTEPISTNPGTIRLLVKGIRVYSNEEPLILIEYIRGFSSLN